MNFRETNKFNLNYFVLILFKLRQTEKKILSASSGVSFSIKAFYKLFNTEIKLISFLHKNKIIVFSSSFICHFI